ncbi:MAG: hypothetical protein EPO25_18380 [Gammaproteobacteria bacterium]|nr:MAG: hypothetical protein EPO25_18380 [Gammaproteobacteria bacterium]
MMQPRFWRLLLPAVFAVASGCVVQETRPLPQLQATQATASVPSLQLLDVGLHLFDPGIPPEVVENPEAGAKLRLFPEIRRAEARFLPSHLRGVLEGTGHWGAVRVVPASVNSFDVTVDGRILESTGTELRIAVTAVDATGRVWIENREYQGSADTRTYRQDQSSGRDPFENVHVAVAEDLLAARNRLTGTELADVRRVASLRFAADFAPVAYSQYLEQDSRSGRYRVLRMPAEDDPLLARITQIRERDYGMVDAVSEHYASFAEKIAPPYLDWRRYTYDEIVAEEKLKGQARSRIGLGAAAVLAAVLVPDSCSSDTCSRATSAARYGAAAGGVAAVVSGMRKREEAKIHTESIKEISSGFDAAAAPLVVEVEGRALRLTGTAEEQYAEWRRLLHELYREETGLVPSAAAAGPADAG